MNLETKGYQRKEEWKKEKRNEGVKKKGRELGRSIWNLTGEQRTDSWAPLKCKTMVKERWWSLALSFNVNNSR